MTFPKSRQKHYGTVVPVSALKTCSSCGVGEFPDLIPFADFCKKAGFDIIQLLPVNDTGTDNSPYNALSAFALHPLFIRLQDIPEAEPFKAEIEEFRIQASPKTKTDRFNYKEILHKKNVLLHAMFNKAEETITEDAETGQLAAWIQKNPWIAEYAVFKNMKRQNLHTSWKEWKTMRFPTHSEIEDVWEKSTLSIRRELLFYAWVQMHLHNQLYTAVRYCNENGILVKGDIPILLNEDSVEVWAHPEYFRTDLRAGSPPDGDNPQGQNWGFPIYNWNNLQETGFEWWKNRLKHAAVYFNAYRLDHILGFFRIWAIPEGEPSGVLGKPLPYAEITVNDLHQIGFSSERIRWIAEPHVPTAAVQEVLNNDYLYTHGVLHKIMNRIGNEELWLFKPEIKTEADIRNAAIPAEAVQVLCSKWRDRMLVAAGKSTDGKTIYTVACNYAAASAWYTLSDREKEQFKALIAEKETLQNTLWKRQAEKILTELCTSVDMLPCAEDLGAIPSVLPQVLHKLHIYTLKVFRWERSWQEDGQPFIPLKKYPKEAVAVTSVHDSSTLRQWWDEELLPEDMPIFFQSLGIPQTKYRQYCCGTKPPYSEDLAVLLLRAFASTPALLSIFPIQDWLGIIHSSLEDIPARKERINTPGTVSPVNWTYRLPFSVEEMLDNQKLIDGIRHIIKK